MNTERLELGDIDIDLAPSKRPTIFKAIRKMRGELGIAQVATFGTEGTRSAILTACFTEGTKVFTKDGEKEIETITSQDIVWTTNGWEKVISPTYEKWKKDFVEIEGNYGFEDKIISTSNHQFLILPNTNQHKLNGKINNNIINELIPNYKNFSDNKKSKYRNYIRNIKPEWVEAKDVKEKDYLLSRIDTTVIKIETIPCDENSKGNKIKDNIFINNEFCEWLGIWLAEGSLNRSMISFTISYEEEELLNRIIFLTKNIFGLENPYIYKRELNNSIIIQYTSAPLRNFLYCLFEINSYKELNQWNKYIPKKLMFIEPQKQLQIFKGWIIGDGYTRTRKNQEWSNSREAKGTTVSRQLAFDMKKILHRNFLNPSLITENRENKTKVYNLILSGDVAQKIAEIKYTNFEKELIINWEDRLGKDLPCVYKDNLYMRYKIKTKKIIPNKEEKKVYCLMVESENFTVSDVIVHNCRGYRSEEYTDGIDSDVGQYMSSLIPSERGFLWSLQDVVYGNESKDRKPVTTFINEVNQYPGLLEIMTGIEGLINKRSSHASGIILYGEDPYETACFMKTPSGDLITQYDLHDCERAGDVKYDFLLTQVQDIIITAIELMQNDNIIEKDKTLREIYNKYLHPSVLPINDNRIWDALSENSVLKCFQFDSPVGATVAKKLKPQNPLEMSDANSLMRLMASEKGAELPMDKYARFKSDISLWYKEMDMYGITKEQQEILKPYFLPSYGVPPQQEQMMTILMDEKICHFTLKEGNAARKIVGKKQMDKIPELQEKIFNQAETQNLAKYIWDAAIKPQLG